MNCKDKETWLHMLAAGHMGGLAGNPNHGSLAAANRGVAEYELSE